MNYLAVIVAAVAYLIIGALWFSPALFGSAWMKGIGKTKEQLTGGSAVLDYLVGLITSFLVCYGLARLMIWTGRGTIVQGIVLALLVGICFFLATILMQDTFEKRSKGLTISYVLYHWVGLIVAAVIIGAWR